MSATPIELRRQALARNDGRCFNCSAPAVHAHHIVPRSTGGADVLTNLASLCEACHGKVHGKDMCNHRTLSMAGVERARVAGKRIGRPKAHNPERSALVLELQAQGKSVRAIAAATGLSKSAVGRILKAAA